LKNKRANKAAYEDADDNVAVKIHGKPDYISLAMSFMAQ
jgi:hypothetical protein